MDENSRDSPKKPPQENESKIEFAFVGLRLILGWPLVPKSEETNESNKRMSTRLPISSLFIIAALGISLFARRADAQSWNNHSRDSQHTALSSIASQPLNAIRWQTPVDLNPQYSGDDLLIHYGSPLGTLSNTIIVPVKTGASDGFRVEGRNGVNGSLIWSQTTDYILPPHNWVPSYSPTLTPSSQRLYFAGAGGTVLYRDNVDANSGATGRLAFFGISNYNLNPAAYNNAV